MAKTPTPKIGWLDRAKQTAAFHVKHLKDDTEWQVRDTAKALNRSIGSISEDILIAQWCKTHESQLKELKYAHEALSFIREKKKKMLLDAGNLH